MQPESVKYLRDMLEHADTIHEYTAGHTLENYLKDRALRDAVNWNYCVIGEALAQLKRIDELTAKRISEHWRIIGLRNQLIHGYGLIEYEVTWRIINTKLPVLIQEIQDLLGK